MVFVMPCLKKRSSKQLKHVEAQPSWLIKILVLYFLSVGASTVLASAVSPSECWTETLEQVPPGNDDVTAPKFSMTRSAGKKYSFVVRVPKKCRVGEPIEVSSILSNTSTDRIGMIYQEPGKTWFYEVIREDGKKVNVSDLGLAENTPNKYVFFKMDCRSLLAGYRLIRTADVGKYFDMSLPGIYKIRLWRYIDEYSPEQVKVASEAVTVEITN